VVVLVGYPGDVDVETALAAGAADVWVLEVGEEVVGSVDVRVALARYYARLQAENLRVGGEFALMRRALDLSGTGVRAHRSAPRGRPRSSTPTARSRR
jgi:hypothetical protein